MPDNFQAETVASGDQIFATDFRASDSAHFPIGKIAHGGLDTFTLTSTSAPFPVQIFSSDSNQPLFVNNNSATQLYVRADSNNPVFVRDENSTTVTVTNIAGNDTVFTQTGYSTIVTVTNIADNDTTVTVTGYTSSVGLIGQSAAAGGLTAVTGALSSTAFDVMTAVGRLYGYAVFNPDTAANVFMKIYEDNGTLGTQIAVMDIMIPFGGGANVSIPQGITMSSGMTVTIAATAGSTVHDTPSTAGVGTFWFAPST